MTTVYIAIKKIAYVGTEILEVFDNRIDAELHCQTLNDEYNNNYSNDAERCMVIEKTLQSHQK